MRQYIILMLSVLICAACSHIDENERLIYVKPESAKRVVLLEDFTGQRCVNCPKATEVIEQLQQTYGDSAIIAVCIHGGPLGFMGNDKYEGLATDAGNEYFTHWGLEYQPVGLVNRHGAVNYTDWAKVVKEELAKPAPLEMSVQTMLTKSQINIQISEFGTDGQVEGKLQVWILEDSISALQMMPDGTANSGYVHNHVLRTTVNGLWGEHFHISEGEMKVQALTKDIEEGWDVNKLSVVAFVYNELGVQQAVKASINNK